MKTYSPQRAVLAHSTQFGLTLRRKFSALILLGSLAACGGDSNGGSPVYPITNTEFTRMGMDMVNPDGISTSTSGDLGATIDASANITFTTPLSGDPNFPYNFTFPSGLPGGALAADGSTNLFTATYSGTNKTVRILNPAETGLVQNVFWTNADNPSIYGFGETGYRLIPSEVKWQTSGIATNSGTAFQYVVDRFIGTGANAYGYALYTLNATATVNYATNTMVINFKPGGTLINISANSSMNNAVGNQLGATLNLTDLDFSGQYFNYLPVSNQPSGLGLGFNYVETLEFFGSDPHELAGVVTYSSYATLNPPINSNPNYLNTKQTFAFALDRQ